MSIAPRESLDVRSPFLRADAAALGIHPRVLRSTRFHRVFKGVYVSSDVPLDVLTRTRAALLLHPPSAHASHTTAARLYGLPVPDESFVHVTVSKQDDRSFRPGLKPHVREAPSDVVLLRGVRVSAPLQLFVEVAGMLPLVDAVVVVDAMLNLKLVTLAQLGEHCDRIRGQRHSRAARRVLSFAREGVASGMETRLRLLLVLAGVPEPQVNYHLRDRYGVVLRYFDLCYPKGRLVVEYDGRHHIERIAQWESDVDRREEIDLDHWHVLVVTSAGIYKDPARTIRRVRRALRARGLPVGRPSDAWRAHFPGRP